jgi:hypothetical protein
MLGVEKWIESLGNPLRAGRALRGGISKDPNFVPQEPFFVNGRSKNPFSPIRVPLRFERVPPSKLPDRRVPYVDTPEGKLKPSQLLDQYLEGVKGGKEALLEEVEGNYKRDERKLPWGRDLEDRERALVVETLVGNPNETAYFDPSGDRKAMVSADVDLVSLSKDGKAYFGMGDRPLTFSEAVLHELCHGATYDHSKGSVRREVRQRVMMGQEAGREVVEKGALERPYMFASSEEYKVGALTFLNRSRQLTGNRLTNPQEVHQLFDEIEKDPSILGKNYSAEEARLFRTYLLLKEVKPKAAELLRNAVARDGQYLAMEGKNRTREAAQVGIAAGPKEISPEVLASSAQLGNLDLKSVGGLAALEKQVLGKVGDWVKDFGGKAVEKKPLEKRGDFSRDFGVQMA